MAVNEYNQHLSGKAGNVSLDWKLIKAMVWVKTGVQPLKPLAFCLLALASLTRAMATDKVRTERDLYVVCSADSQAGMRDCLARKADESVKALAAAQEAVAETLGKWDEERQYVDHAKARLAASNQAFPDYRSAQRELSASLSGGAAGNAYEMGKLACVTELNKRWARQLRDAVADLPLK